MPCPPFSYFSGSSQALRSAVARSSSLCRTRLRPQIDALPWIRSQASWSCLIERQFPRDSSEQISDVLSGLGGGLEEEEARFSGVGFSVSGLDGALIWVIGHHIGFIAGEGNDDVLVGLALKLFHPGFGFV